MRLSETLPQPDEVAQKIVEARAERVLLRRLYRLVLDAKRSKTVTMVDLPKGQPTREDSNNE